MKSRLLVSIILATTLFLAGCGEIPFFVQPKSYLLPQIMVKTPTTGPDGYNWIISEQGELIIEKEGESVTLEKGENFYAEGTEWEFNGVEEKLVILKPVIEKVDAMDEMRKLLD